MRPGLLLGRVIKEYEGDKTEDMFKKNQSDTKCITFLLAVIKYMTNNEREEECIFTHSSTGVESMVRKAWWQEPSVRKWREMCAGAQLTYVHALSFSDVFRFVVCVCLHVCICAIMQIPTELDLQAVVSHLIGC